MDPTGTSHETEAPLYPNGLGLSLSSHPTDRRRTLETFVDLGLI